MFKRFMLRRVNLIPAPAACSFSKVCFISGSAFDHAYRQWLLRSLRIADYRQEGFTVFTMWVKYYYRTVINRTKRSIMRPTV